MWRTYWLSAIIVALVIAIPNVIKSALVHGVGPSILALLLHLAAYTLAVRRACAGRTRRILIAALIAGIDVSSLAALLVCAFQLSIRSRRPDLQSILTLIPIMIGLVLVIGILFSLAIGAVIAISRSADSNRITENEASLSSSIFAGRRAASFVPFALCIAVLISTALAGIFLGHATRTYESQNAKLADMLNAGPKIGTQAPVVATTTLDGRPWRIADHRGKVVVIDFWATWCKPCIESMPMLERLRKEYGNRGDLVIVGVSIDQDRSALENFLKTHEMRWPILYENDADSGNSVARQFDVVAIPSLWIIDKNGRIAAKHVSAETELRSKIAESLAEQPI